MQAPEAGSPAQLAGRLRQSRPRVHCLTNSVARAFTANVLLAVGAVPSMSADPAEVGEFVAGADALLVNLGILTPAMRDAVAVALDAASTAGIPWVLDPVFADRSAARADHARALLGRRPTALRLNAAEAEALGDAALGQAQQAGTVIALSGETDCISLGARACRIGGGHPLMAQVTGMGCALGAVVAAFLTLGEEPFAAVAAAVLAFGTAGRRAGAAAAGPGSFVPLFLDELHRLDTLSFAPEDVAT